MITRADAVGLTIRRAQAWVLNPGISESVFLNMPAEQLQEFGPNQLKFSCNVVYIDISVNGLQIPDFTVLNLPGTPHLHIQSRVN